MAEREQQEEMPSGSGEVRRSKLNGDWVIYAPARGKRPKDLKRQSSEHQGLPAHDPECPFCPGNEAQLPGILLEIPSGKQPGWRTRVVPNKYPALNPQDSLPKRTRQGIYLNMENHGHHEVLIETPLHNRDLAQMPDESIRAVIETYHRRYTQLMEASDCLQVMLFRNHGKRAGTSLIHPHSQLIATYVVPQHIRQREQIAQQHYDTWGSCLVCEILEYERKSGIRMVLENERFTALVPYAAEVPFETWIIPRTHHADFGSISIEEQDGLALILRDVLARLRQRLEDPDYNYVINTAPRFRAEEPHLHWFLQIRPRLITPAGFEVGSGMRINPSIPEEDAAYLRGEA